ncbi:MAG: rhodanese-like domain-containing protein [Wenzhouxiangella sp.]|jgi:rhodanese-related sulfurtransferase|nr:rhodanese-like domain-containing protein [Wenzhouxiangella sp.]
MKSTFFQTMRALGQIGLLIAFLAPFSALAQDSETVKGRVMDISRKAQTIQINVQGQDPVVVRFNADTQFVGAEGITDVGGNELIEVTYVPGSPAATIEKIVFGLPEGVEISTDELLALMTGEAPYTLVDARPARRFLAATIPTSVNAYPGDGAEAVLSVLPQDKSQLVIFYCGGPTCPYTGQSVDIAMEAGYTNVKGYQAGAPNWKKRQLPMHTDPKWLSERLNPGHVVIDVRAPATAASNHIPTAVAMQAADFQAMTETFINEQKPAMLPGVADKKAPIILYANTHVDPQLLAAFTELRSWGYSGVSVIRDGFNGWTAAGLPTASNALASTIVYERQLAPGAMKPAEFAAMSFPNDSVQVLDVRSDEEAAAGMIPGAIHIGLDNLEDQLAQLDKSKPMVIHCSTGVRAQMAYQLLKDEGFDVSFVNETLEIAADGSYEIL